MKNKLVLTLSLFLTLAVVDGWGEEAPIKNITWEKGAPMKYALKFHVQGVLGDKLICAAGTQVPGCGVDSSTDRVWLFDPKTGAYEDLPPVPETLGRPEGIVVGEDLYVLGGVLCPDKVPKGSPTYNRRMWRLSRRSGNWKWDKMPTLPHFRLVPAITRADKTIILAGGRGVFNPEEPSLEIQKSRHPSVELNSVIAFDTDKPEKGWYDLPPIPRMARVSPTIASIGRKVYVFGGSYWKTWQNQHRYPNLEMAFCGDAYVLDLDKVVWRQIPDLPFPEWGTTAVPYGKHSILLIGGERNGRVEHPYQYADKWRGKPGSPNSEVLVYDTQLETYRVLPDPLPLVTITDELREEIEQVQALIPPLNPFAGYDYSRGIRRQATRVSLIGDRLYLLGNVMGVGERTMHGTNELLVGTIHK